MNQKNLNKNLGNDNSIAKLKQHGGNIVAAIAVVLASYFGWQYWQNKGASFDEAAADQFDNIKNLNNKVSILNQNPEMANVENPESALQDAQSELDTAVSTLVNEHGDTVYAWQTHMLQAKKHMDAEDYGAAADSLKNATEVPIKDDGLIALTQLRYAQALLADEQADAAMSAASSDMPGSFEPSRQELLGDIYLKQGDKESAIRSYTNAWDALTKRQSNRAILALKMEALGIEFEPIEQPQLLLQEPESISASIVQDAESAEVDAE